MIMDIIVIGGGAAGMMAAYAAATEGASVLLLEKNEKLGKKIYITGKGRCNVTNACDMDGLIRNQCRNAKFLFSAFRQFSNTDMMELLEEAGCKLKTERGDRVFPVSDHASDVTKALTSLLKAAGVEIRLGTTVSKIERLSEGGFAVYADMGHGRGEERLVCRRLIIATGGLSYPTTGSTGDGYMFAESLGLNVKPCVPSLVPLILAEQEEAAELAGLSLKNVSLSLYKGSRLLYEELGELIFTHRGVSGPLVLTVSSIAGEELSKSLKAGIRDESLKGIECVENPENIGSVEKYRSFKSPEGLSPASDDGFSTCLKGLDLRISIDLKPALSHEKLDARLLRDFESAKNQDIKNGLRSLLLSSLIAPVLKRAGIAQDKKVNSVTKEERRRLIDAVKGLDYKVIGLGGFNEAVITKGGIDVKEIDPRTMEAKKVPGLYFAGEVLDIDARTGGFNLQDSWSSGYAAGKAAGNN